ncbi:hypothetical protein NGA_0182510 [Nannochloropsis gaditana CCMP526]|uniref:uncharacterized protein n=1 Tax=Nannochloropsis gaditana (strain CCMP526) TaxID=1093141 RepID=UPI00029F6574|nr:hypothetical protein NGA_0182510 [Nannochloropsis gaditana CCMP526]EKU22193.1 hypothetical protein NGA_0182510 [Nannochloropsis gaditana CCMP526]|eukprot:XP_005854170.1 hypothetical protein NGA_0182510 [Nannochloropsis gaditana CCMP526]
MESLHVIHYRAYRTTFLAARLGEKAMSAGVEAARRRSREDRTTSQQEEQRPLHGESTVQGLDYELDSPLRRNFKALLVLAVSVYGLKEAKFVENLLWNKKVGGAALAVSVAASSIFVLLWAYLDVYVGAVLGKQVDYPEARRVTHALLVSLLVTLVSLTIAVWPIYQATALVLVCMLSYGVLFQVVILVPASVYNPLFFALQSLLSTCLFPRLSSLSWHQAVEQTRSPPRFPNCLLALNLPFQTLNRPGQMLLHHLIVFLLPHLPQHRQQFFPVLPFLPLSSSAFPTVTRRHRHIPQHSGPPNPCDR